MTFIVGTVRGNWYSLLDWIWPTELNALFICDHLKCEEYNGNKAEVFFKSWPSIKLSGYGNQPNKCISTFNMCILYHEHSMPITEVHYKGHITKVFEPHTNAYFHMVQILCKKKTN
jgi:hypothetical protein